MPQARELPGKRKPRPDGPGLPNIAGRASGKTAGSRHHAFVVAGMALATMPSNGL